MSEATFYRQPPGWALTAAGDQLGPDAPLGDLMETAWELVQRDES